VVLCDVLEILNNVCGVEMDQQIHQLEATNGNRKEASNCRGAGVFEARASEGKRLESRQGHGELGNIVVVQLEGASVIVASTVTEGIYVEIDQVLKYLDCGGEEGVGSGTGAAIDCEGFQGSLRFRQRCHTLLGGNIVL